jgi:hypothetical protein
MPFTMLGTVHISTVTVRSFTLWPEENRAGTKARYGVAFVCTAHTLVQHSVSRVFRG